MTPEDLSTLLDEANHHPWESVKAALSKVDGQPHPRIGWLTTHLTETKRIYWTLVAEVTGILPPPGDAGLTRQLQHGRHRGESLRRLVHLLHDVLEAVALPEQAAGGVVAAEGRLAGRDEVAELEVVVGPQVDAALVALLDFAHVVLEALEADHGALVHDFLAAPHDGLGVAFEAAVGDVRPGDVAALGVVDDHADFGATQVLLLENGFDVALDQAVDLVDEEPRPGAWGHDVAFLHPRSTGGVLVESPETLREAYRTGRGSLRLRARWHREDEGQGRWVAVVTEIPYQVQKGKLIEAIAALVTLPSPK